MGQDVRGFAVLDAQGYVRFAAGLCADQALTKELSRRWQARGREPLPALFTLKAAGGGLSALSLAAEQAVCFLVHRHDAGDPLFTFMGCVDFAVDILRHFITNPYEAITVIDAQGLVRYLSPVHEKFFNLPSGAGVGRPVREVIENTRLDSVLRTAKAEIGQIQEMQGATRVVSRTPIFDGKRRVVGVIGQVMFKNPEAVQRLGAEIDRLRKEVAFYRRELLGAQRQRMTLDSIIGTSKAVMQLKAQILKIAPLDVPVLLLGESGVGKEVVAHAPTIRWSSSTRRRYPCPWWKANSSATRAARLPARSAKGAAASSNRPIGVPCFWTKLVTCRWKSRSNCCAPCRMARSSA